MNFLCVSREGYLKAIKSLWTEKKTLLGKKDIVASYHLARITLAMTSVFGSLAIFTTEVQVELH